MTYDPAFLDALADTLEHEGGWSDHPNDPGGKTFRGVTKKAWEAHVGRPVTADELKRLTWDDIADFYFRRYWQACRCSALPHGVSALVFDIAVNSGPRRAAIILQAALQVLSRISIVKDGIIGRKTIEAANATDRFAIIAEMGFRRQTFYSRLKTFHVFGDGWTRRNSKTVVFATAAGLRMAGSIINRD